MQIKELDKNLIERANSCSFNGTRGKLRESSYKNYVDMVLGWDISEDKKKTILDKLYDKNMEILKYESQHVSVMVAGPARYNPKKFDKSDKILELTHNLCVWLEELEKQVKEFKQDKNTDNIEETKRLIKGIERLYELKIDPREDIVKLAYINNDAFIKVYEKYNEIFKWRKNSNIYKIYQKSLNGEIQERKREVFFEDGNFIAYIEDDRAYIKFIVRPQRQLMVALKSRKWWWNSYKQAWSTHLDKLDRNWVESISEKYAKYI